MKVLVTGGCGFVGSHVCEYYLKKGDNVVALDNMTKYELLRTGYNTELARSYNRNLLRDMGAITLKADVRDSSILSEISNLDFIVHTAAQPAVTISIEDPKLDISSNILGTFNVLELARNLKIPIVSCATIHVYGNKINDELVESESRYCFQYLDISEERRTGEGTLTPLHASKISADLYVKTYIDTYGIEAASFRLTGLYGERQLGGEDHGWVANFAIRTLLGEPINIYGTGKQVRDILYVKDLCEAFDAFYKTRKSGIYNIGSGYLNSISLIECIGLIEKITGLKPKVNYLDGRKGDLRYFVCDTEKAKQELKWNAKTHPEEGITNLINWIKDNLNLFKI